MTLTPPLLSEPDRHSARTADVPRALVAAPKERVRLEYLDGIRGLASLTVLVCHTFAMTSFLLKDGSVFGHRGEQATGYLMSEFMHYGRLAVGIFIVLSGYCLMLPVARSADGTLRGGFGPYIMRRAQRILPPYFAALLLVCIIRLSPSISMPGNLWIDRNHPLLSTADVVSHLFLVHNFNPEWFTGINMSFWSIAVEWQIYFLFPLLLLPLWRRFGNTTLILISCLGTIAWEMLHFPPLGAVFVALFAFGMAAASMNFVPGQTGARRGVPIVRGIPIAVTCFIAQEVVQFLQRASFKNVAALHYFRDETWGGPYITDILVGVGMMCLLASLTFARQQGAHSNKILMFLESRPVLNLGAMSYSVYLVHMPLLQVIAYITERLQVSILVQAIAVLPLSLVLVLSCARLFYHFFERPFVSSPSPAST